MSINTTTNQRLAEAGEGRCDEMRPRRNAWGELFPVILGSKWGDQREREREGPSVGLKRPPLATTLNNNQPKTVRAMRMVFGMRFDRGGTFREDNSHCFGRRFDLCKMKQYTP